MARLRGIPCAGMLLISLFVPMTGLCAEEIAPPTDAGKKLFESKMCMTCHSLEPDKVVVGPSLAHIASRYDKAFLLKQLEDPQKNFPFSTGYKDLKDKTPKMPKPLLTPEEKKALLDYLMTLK